MEKNKGLWILAIYFFLSVYLLPIFPDGQGTDGELARWATAASLIEKSSFDIAWTREITGEPAGAVTIGERVYAAEPPGTAVLTAPFYAVARVLTGPSTNANLRITKQVMRFFIAAVPLLLLALWLYAHETDELSLAALLFATPLFASSLTLAPDVLVAVLLYFAFRLIFDTERIFLRHCLLAGFLCGAAVLCALAAVVPALVFAAGLFFAARYDRRSSLFVFALGAAPPLILLAVYNYAVFGSPLASVYGYASYAEGAQSFAHLAWPGLGNFYQILFSPSRGLFFYAPILFLPLVVFVTSRERKTWRHRVKVATILISIVAFSAAPDAPLAGGRLVIVLPLLLDSFFDGEIYELSNLWQGLLLTISFWLATLPALTFTTAPLEFKYPHNSFWGKFLFVENVFTPGAGALFGLDASLWTILPVLSMLVFVMYLVWRYSRRPQRYFIGAVIGLVCVGVYLFLPNLDSDADRRRRAAIVEHRSASRDFTETPANHSSQ